MGDGNFPQWLSSSSQSTVISQTSDPQLQVSISKFTYGDIEVLHQIDFQLNTRETLAVIGDVGSGKTTLLRCIVQLHEGCIAPHFQGQIALKGQLMEHFHLSDWRRLVSWVSPSPLVGSIYRNLSYGLELHGYQGSFEACIERSLRQVGLWEAVRHRLTQPVFRLDPLQQYLLCVARSLALSPDVLLFDEPGTTLNQFSQQYIEALLRDLGDRYSLIFATRDPRRGVRIASQLAVLNEGTLIESGSSLDVWQHPRHPQTARYLRGDRP